MNVNNSLIFLIISIVLYYTAPEHYSFSYCLILCLIFILCSIIVIKRVKSRNNYFNFHTLFLVSFFFVNFVYPVFLYPHSPYYFSVFKKEFNHDIITRATALALVGSSAYNFGVSFRTKRISSGNINLDTNLNTILFILINWSYIVFFILFLFAGREMLKGNFGSTSKIPAGLLVIFQISMGLSVILEVLTKRSINSVFDFTFKFNKPILILLFLYIGLFIYTGDRGPVIQIVLIIVGSYTLLVKGMKLRSFILLIFAGMLILTFISYARSKNTDKTGEVGVSGFIHRGMTNLRFDSFLDLGMDLIICNRNLYVGYDYVSKVGLNYGKSMFYYVFSPIPFLPSFMTQILFDAPPDELTSAYIITKEANSTYGLGTNIIADLYMAFGLVGVILFMFLLGFVIVYLENKADRSNHSIYYIIAYLFMIGFSIYLPRSSIFSPMRHIIWVILLFEFTKMLRLSLLKLSSQKQSEN